jgi:hypothetical protein
MKMPFLHRFWICHLLLAGAVLLSAPAYAKERFRIPPPPPPEKVVRDIRGFFHRVAHGVKDVSKQTWGAIRERFEEDDRPVQIPRSAARPKPAENPESFSRSKDAVPYRYDDADPFDPKGKPQMIHPANDDLPQVNVTTRDPARTGQVEQVKPAQPSNRNPFLTPEPGPAAAPTQPASLPGTPSTPPKATVPPADANIEFARPVPGKRGLVYPPGARESQEYMVDVGDFPTGQIVRDPRTGKLFRVP